MVDVLPAYVATSGPRSCSCLLLRPQRLLHRAAFSWNSRSSSPFQQSETQRGCGHKSRCRRSWLQTATCSSTDANKEPYNLSRRALGLCAASLALQLGQGHTEAQARSSASYDMAASNQAATNQVLPEATTVLQSVSTASKFKPGQKQVLAINKRVQTQNKAPLGFPNFVREGYEIIILADGYEENQDGLIWKDFEEGKGTLPQDGQQVTFDYTAYNESGSRIDSTYQKGRPAQTRLGINGLIPGFEKGIKTMKVGGKTRLVVSPALGPPVGPSTFFSAKQCEVFDVELLDIKSCRRRQVAMFSDVVCE